MVQASGVRDRADLWDDGVKLRYMVHRPKLGRVLGMLRVFSGTSMYVPSRALIEGPE